MESAVLGHLLHLTEELMRTIQFPFELQPCELALLVQDVAELCADDAVSREGP